MRRSGALLPVWLAAAIGCSGGGAGSSGSDPRPGDPQVATVTFRAAFPSVAGKSLIDWSDTSSIEIRAEGESGTSAGCTLSAGSELCTLTLPVGHYALTAERLDAALTSAEVARSAGQLVPGVNEVVLTFLSGFWTLDQPIVLSSGDELRGFGLAYDPTQPTSVPRPFGAVTPPPGSRYSLVYDLAAGPGSARILHAAGFDGGALNRSALDGGGYSLTNGCGEADGPDAYDGACAGRPGDDPEELWIRLLGDAGEDGDACRGDCSPGDRAVWRLLPGKSFDPDLGPLATTTVVDGGHIAGTVIEYRIDGHLAQVVEVTEPFVPPAPSGLAAEPGQPFSLLVSDHRPVVVCREGFNGGGADPEVVEEGEWDFAGCSGGFDVSGERYHDCGQLPQGGDPGECSWGLQLADGNVGEWCDGTWDALTRTCDATTSDQLAQPDEFVDMDEDGLIDTGSFFFSRFLTEYFDVSGRSYAFTATGAAGAW